MPVKKGNMDDLRELLFEQLTKVMDAEPDVVEQEVKKSQAVIGIATQILDSVRVEKEVIQTVKELNSSFIPTVGQQAIEMQRQRELEPVQFNLK